jgi:Xaa-Pro aminopeptidase
MRFPDSATLGARHARLREAFAADPGLDALVVTSPQNIRYLTNHAGSAGVVVLTREAVHLLVDFRYEEAVRALQESGAACPDLTVWPVPASYDEALVHTLAELDEFAVGFEATNVTVARHAWWRDTIAARRLAVELRATSDLVERARQVKDQWEVTTMRESAARLSPVIDRLLGEVGPGMTERQVAGRIEALLRDAGYERLAFDTIVASGPNGALPHHRAGDRAIAAGELVVLDFGGVLDGYCCDLTLTIHMGVPSAEARRVYNAVLEAQRAAIAATKPGIDATAVDAAAREVLTGHGLGEAFGHGTGHGLGLDVHEEPRVGRPRAGVSPATLVPNMIFTIEPGAYLPGWGGVRIEDDVLVTDAGCEVLTSAPRELLAIG